MSVSGWRIRWGVIEDARARQRRERRAAALVVAAAIGAGLLAIAYAGGGAPSVAKPTSASRPAPRPAGAVLASCRPSQPAKALHATPSRSLLSILGVLRRPATSADALPAGIEERLLRRPLGGGIFVNYVRRARVVAGTSYWVYPEITDLCGHQQEGMAGWESDGSRGSGGGMGDAATIEQGQGRGGLGGFWHTVLEMLVPNGVQRVVLRYPAGRVGGFNRHQVPAITITTRVVGNLMVITVPRGGKRLLAPVTMTWVAANGRVIKTFNQL